MRFLFLLFLSLSALYGSKVVEVGEKFQDSQKCKACHLHLVRDWENSWHAKSHYESDEYLRKTIEYVSRKTRKSLNGVIVECAACHNPRISVTSTGLDYEIMALMDLDEGSEVNKALENDPINEGINCVVCHNIDKIHDEKDDSVRGIHRVTWTKTGVMTGPYEDAKSPYHKVEHRDFMDENSDQLCFVCHANDRSIEGLVFTDMKREYSPTDKKCVDCHMGEKKLGYAASLKIDNGKRKEREIRGHGFEGAHTELMWRNALNLALVQEKKELVISIENPNPHNIPSGFGARELLVELQYYKGETPLEAKSLSLTTHYTSKRGKPTIPHLAQEATKDMSIPANGKKVLKLAGVDGATKVEATLYYRLVNDEVHKLLELKEPIWSKKFYIQSETIKLK